MWLLYMSKNLKSPIASNAGSLTQFYIENQRATAVLGRVRACLGCVRPRLYLSFSTDGGCGWRTGLCSRHLLTEQFASHTPLLYHLCATENSNSQHRAWCLVFSLYDIFLLYPSSLPHLFSDFINYEETLEIYHYTLSHYLNPFVGA